MSTLSIQGQCWTGQSMRSNAPMKGDIVDLTPPTPKPIRNMETAKPGTPAPLSKATGRDVMNIVVAPHIQRLIQKKLGVNTRNQHCSEYTVGLPEGKNQCVVPPKPRVGDDGKQHRCQEGEDEEAVGD